MTKILELEAYQAVACDSASKALSLLQTRKADLIITDLRMPGVSGLELLRSLRKRGDDTPLILLTAYGTVNDAVEAMKLGAVDFLAKPIRRESILKAVSNALSRSRVMSAGSDTRVELIGQSESIADLRRNIKLLSGTHAPVLITGESGTGKEVVARMIHQESGRKGRLISLNCGAIPENLLESELFGYEKGAFTDALHTKQGLFEAADSGTIFLDEIGDMPASLQVKLLRVLQDGCFFRLGSTVARKVDVRVIAATNSDLKRKIADGLFREDLYYRLHVITFDLPPLRDRKGDIELLANFFLASASAQYGKSGLSFSPSALASLQHYSWPGNVREMRNMIERAVVMSISPSLSEAELGLPAIASRETVEAVVQEKRAGSDHLVFPVGTSLKEMELEAIRRTLEMTGGDKAEAARLLGINLRTIYRKLPELN